MNIGWQEILFILLIALLLFGAKRIPDLARNLGKGLREFKKGLKEIETPEEKNKNLKVEGRPEEENNSKTKE
jgi:sec-independent protein translocase protein TatA